MEKKRFANGKMLKNGYTTGTCAQSATKAAVTMLCGNQDIISVKVTIPSGDILDLEVLNISCSDNSVTCGIRKDGGDDIDVTDGLIIYCKASFIDEKKIIISGGEGIGKVTLPGLDRPVGSYAINSVPLHMIEKEAKETLKKFSIDKGLKIQIFVPNGEKVAEKTFNSKLGIINGISILGTTGIVEPMSSKALIDTIKAEFSVISKKQKKNILLVLGNYGLEYSKNVLKINEEPHVMCSNFIGEALDSAVENDIESILLVSHFGKFVKLSIGMMNTHSNAGDGRIEAIIRAALQSKASIDCLRELDKCISTDSALKVLLKYGIYENVIDILQLKIKETIKKRINDKLKVEFLSFTKIPEISNGIVMESSDSKLMIREMAIGDKNG